jgi:hypothetical protein
MQPVSRCRGSPRTVGPATLRPSAYTLQRITVSPSKIIDISRAALVPTHFEHGCILLPVYADLGVDGAAELLAVVHGGERKQAAIARLAQLYQDEDLMTSIPLEL